VLVLSLWGTGLYLFALPYWVRWCRPTRQQGRKPAKGVQPAALPESAKKDR